MYRLGFTRTEGAARRLRADRGKTAGFTGCAVLVLRGNGRIMLAIDRVRGNGSVVDRQSSRAYSATYAQRWFEIPMCDLKLLE